MTSDLATHPSTALGMSGQHGNVSPTAPAPGDSARAPRLPAPRFSRLAALFIDLALLLLLPGVSLAVFAKPMARLAPNPFSGDALPPARWFFLLLSIPLAFQVAQWILFAATGRTFGAAIVGIGWERPDGRRPGILRALVSRSLPILIFGSALTLLEPNSRAIWVRAGLALVVIGVLLLDALGILLRRRSMRDVASGLFAYARDLDKPRAFEAPRFSGRASAISMLGVLGALAVSSLVYVLFSHFNIESTSIDVPSVAAGVSIPLSLVIVGALAAFAARRFVVGELALTALLTGLLAYEAMLTKVVAVPALQAFEVAGFLDWSLYALSAYFGIILCLILGSALGFMVASDRGADASTKFERLVARRHLRLKLAHWLELAVIATLLPIVIYGVFIWPVRTVWRLMKGRRGAKPLPPTVFMALLTIVGVMFGVTSLNVVLGVMGGFERDLKQKILGTNAHGVVHRSIGDFDEWKKVEAKVRSVPGIKAVSPFILAEVMITTNDEVAGSVIKGIDPDSATSVTDIRKYIGKDEGSLTYLAHPELIPSDDDLPQGVLGGGTSTSGGSGKILPPPQPTTPKPVLPGIILGREMALQLHVWVGDQVTVMNPIGDLGPTGPVPRSQVFRVAAIFVSGMYEYDSKYAYITIPAAQKFFRMGQAVTGLEVRCDNPDEARPLMRQVRETLGGFPYETKDWGQMNENLFSALRLERVVMAILLSFQVLIASICVIATLVMLVVEKRKEVATLKAMGAREGSIMKLFVLEGLIIGGIGAFYGSAAGFLFCELIKKFGVGLDPQVYYITRLPVVIQPASFVAVAGIAMLLVFVATLYPARRGGSISPAEGFREE